VVGQVRKHVKKEWQCRRVSCSGR